MKPDINDIAKELLSKLNHFIVDKNQCWLHQYKPLRDGGAVCLLLYIEGKQYSYLAHRVSYVIYKGNIPPGMDVCHTCDVPTCVNPDHLFLGTRHDNHKDMIEKRRGGGRYGSQLDEEDEAMIIALREKGYTYKDIGRMVGIHYSTVGKVLKRVGQNV